MSLRARKNLATRTALIAAARRLFSEKGYENTTLEEICDEAKIHVTTFFSYFESKEELAFTRTLEMLDSFQRHILERETDVIAALWRFLSDFGLRARGEERRAMVSLDTVPALRNRYAIIIRQYEDSLADALALEAGNDPATDVYSQLLAATLIAAIVTGGRWHAANFGVDADEADTAEFAKLIMSRFPSRAEVEAEQARIVKAAKPRSRSRRKATAKEASPRQRRSRR